jgi:plastocyanin
MRSFPNLNKKQLPFGVPILLSAVILCTVGYGVNALAEPKTHTVMIEAMQFSPKMLEVSQGDTVVWLNKDAFPHDATAISRSFQSQEIAPNGSWKFKAMKKGTFPYICTLHPTMKAELVVK